MAKVPGRYDILLGAPFDTNQGSFQVAGTVPFDVLTFDPPNIESISVVYVVGQVPGAPAADEMEIQLYNQTTASVIPGSTVLVPLTDPFPVKVSSLITLPVADFIVEVQIRRTQPVALRLVRIYAGYFSVVKKFVIE